jgi:hypothetical protein
LVSQARVGAAGLAVSVMGRLTTLGQPFFSPPKIKKIISTPTVLIQSKPTMYGGLAHDPGVDLSKELWETGR